MIVNSHGKCDLCVILTDDVFVQGGLDFLRGGKGSLGQKEFVPILVKLLVDQLTAGFHAVVADICSAGGGDQKLYLTLVSSAEGAAAKLLFMSRAVVVVLSHEIILSVN